MHEAHKIVMDRDVAGMSVEEAVSRARHPDPTERGGHAECSCRAHFEGTAREVARMVDEHMSEARALESA